MKKRKCPRAYFLVFFSICALVALSAFRVGAIRISAPKKQVGFPVKSLVPNLRITDAKVHNDQVFLSLRNDFAQTITAFLVSISGVTSRHELIDSDEPFVPGSTITEPYELPSRSRPEKGVTVRAVVLDDGTAYGDPRSIRQILDARAGRQAQIARILPILQNTLATPQNVPLATKWQSLKLRIADLQEPGEEKSFEFRAAINDEKELLLNKIRQLEQAQQERGDFVARQLLGYVKERYERKKMLLERSLKNRQ